MQRTNCVEMTDGFGSKWVHLYNDLCEEMHFINQFAITCTLEFVLALFLFGELTLCVPLTEYNIDVLV